MKFRRLLTILASTIFISILSTPSHLFAEDIYYNPECRHCPVNIRIAAEEAHKIIGKKGVKFMKNLKDIGSKTIKIDMDEKLKNGTDKDPNTDYEVLVIGTPIRININSLTDTSNIVVYTDIQNIPKNDDYSNWWPQIHLRPFEKIKKYETPDTAWEKMKRSHIYKYISTEEDVEKWKVKLGEKISHILELLTEEKTIQK